jgi:cbb3-type cytochrome oxidase cytochrome c subunit
MISPKAVVPQAKMPAFKGSAEEREALVAYLQSLR